MPAIDADALVALHQTTHPHHADATERFEQAVQLYLHPSVITEFTTVLRRQAKKAGLDGNAVARKALRQLLDQPRVHVEPDVNHDAALTRYFLASRLSFTDAVVAQFKHHHDKQDPITYDDDLRKALRL